MEGLMKFDYGEQLVRTVVREGNPWFVAKDICQVLEISNYRDAIATLDDDEKGVANTDTPGGTQQMRIVNESGMYALIFQSRKEVARKVRKWVTSEVLPAIRRKGEYQVPGLESLRSEMIKAFGALITQSQKMERRLRALEEGNGKQEPGDWYTIREAMAKTGRSYNTIYRHLNEFGVKKVFGRWRLNRQLIDNYCK